MPLCTGVRPFMEDMPSRAVDDIQSFTANTTAPVLAFVNAGQDHDRPVGRQEMLHLIQKSGQLGKHAKQSLLDALYGRELSKEQKEKAAALQLLSLGRKTARAWTGGKLLKKGAGLFWENEGAEQSTSLKPTRVGSYDPTRPDPRGEYKHHDLLLEWAARHEGDHGKSAANAGIVQVEVTSPTKLGGIVGGNKRVAVYIVENDLIPEATLSMVKQMLKATFDHTCFEVDGFTLSVGEMVGLARHEETLHVPHDTAREKAFLRQLRESCQVKLRELLTTRALPDLAALLPVPKWRKEHLEIMLRVLETKPAWLVDAVSIMHKLGERQEHLREHLEALHSAPRASAFGNPAGTPRGKAKVIKMQTGVVPPLPDPSERRFSIAMREPEPERPATARAAYSHAPEPVALDREWRERIEVLRRRDRKFMREELELFFETCIIPVPTPVIVGSSPVGPPTQRAANPSSEGNRRTSLATAPFQSAFGAATGSGARSSFRKAPTLRKPKARNQEMPTTAEMLDKPRYWFDGRMCNQGGDKEGERPLTTQQEQALQNHLRDPVEFRATQGNPETEPLSTKMLALKMLKRSEQTRPRSFEPNFMSHILDLTGVVPGKPGEDPNLLPGSARGACAFRLIPSYGMHTEIPPPVPHPRHPKAVKAGQRARAGVADELARERAAHPVSRHHTGHITSYSQVLEIQELLHNPSIDYSGTRRHRHGHHHHEDLSAEAEESNRGPRIYRPPTQTPVALKKRLQKDLEERRMYRAHGGDHHHQNQQDSPSGNESPDRSPRRHSIASVAGGALGSTALRQLPDVSSAALPEGDYSLHSPDSEYAFHEHTHNTPRPSDDSPIGGVGGVGGVQRVAGAEAPPQAAGFQPSSRPGGKGDFFRRSSSKGGNAITHRESLLADAEEW